MVRHTDTQPYMRVPLCHYSSTDTRLIYICVYLYTTYIYNYACTYIPRIYICVYLYTTYIYYHQYDEDRVFNGGYLKRCNLWYVTLVLYTLPKHLWLHVAQKCIISIHLRRSLFVTVDGCLRIDENCSCLLVPIYIEVAIIMLM